MLFLAIIGLLVFTMAIFSIFAARQTGGGWKTFAIIAVISALTIGYAVYKLPFWSHNQATAAQSNSSASQSSAKLSSSHAVFNEDTTKKAAATIKLKENNILKQLKSNYHTIGTVTLDRTTKTFTVNPTNKDYVQSLKTIQKYPDKNQKARTTITTNFQTLSSSIQKNLAAGYTIRLMQPEQPDNTLLSVKDGKIIINQLQK
ncbi:hypothetical protein C5Z25_01435 [Lactobacillus sp. CBA3605]|uniref:hypothetical protein n=1 Tax=Lactobacillus sp. CBA3605 TaxID=2099788 RepID=UPI000CFD2D2F|nr:hypothetical protein [Lactobacillus sp. CBA3605]AVK60517.1 hypothetical protein C5Z25_01435 [Lactobacillus sp. CBA3605]